MINDEEHIPKINHLKLNHLELYTPDPERTADLYKQVFAMQEVGRGETAFAQTISLSDGYINFSVARFGSPEKALSVYF